MNKFISSLLSAVFVLACLILAPAQTLTVLAVAALCAGAVFIVANVRRHLRRWNQTSAVNIAEGTHKGSITKLTDAALATRFLLVKFGSDVNHIAVNGAADRPLGVCTDEAAAAEENVNVAFLGATGETLKVVASEAIALTDDIWTAANGKVQNVTATAGTYYMIGRPLQIAGADGDVIEIEPCYPVKIVVS